MICEHEHSQCISRDENDDRIRKIEVCNDCGMWRLNTYAFRLDEEGCTAWGPPGEWWSSEWKVPS